MQPLFAFLIQLASKAWISVVITIVSATAVAAVYLSPIGPGSDLKPGSRPVLNVPGAPATHPGQCNSVPVVPEANAGWVLVPVVGAMLLFSSRRFRPAKAPAAAVDHTGLG